MTSFGKFICATLASALLSSCSQVLETVDLTIANSDAAPQEEFSVEETTLTFESARRANTDPYPRSVLSSGHGNTAGPIREAEALVSSFPASAKPAYYQIGIGDELSFSIFSESVLFSNVETSFPPQRTSTDYVIGIGDELTLIRASDAEGSPASGRVIENDGLLLNLPSNTQKPGIIATSGRVGSDGSILLLEIGRIEAAGKTLSDIQAEVRNLLIRDGLSPRFQLEITNFASQRAIVNIKSGSSGSIDPDATEANSSVIILNDRASTLRDILAAGGRGVSSATDTLVTLQRDGATYRMHLRDVFSSKSQDVQIMDGDVIFVEDLSSAITSGTAQVSADGSVLLPDIGRLSVDGLSIEEINRIAARKIRSTADIKKTIDINVSKFSSGRALLHFASTVAEARNTSQTEIIISSELETLSAVLTRSGVKFNPESITRITLKRGVDTYKFTLKDLLDLKRNIYVLPNDKIFVDRLSYRENKVFVVGGVTPRIVKIDPKERQSLADVLFTPNGVFSASGAKRSEVYLLRGSEPVKAYHLDAQSPTRLIVADAMELRPNDILYVAERPIISFNRTLTTIVPLRVLIRDIQNDNIP